MAGLVVSLAPYEKVLIGGIVMQNGAKKTSLRVLDEAAGVLRLTDALHPDDARTPLTRCYYVAQLLLTNTAGPGGEALLSRLLADARAGFEGFAFASDLAAAETAAGERAWFRVMRRLRPLLPQEAALMADPRFAATSPAMASAPDLPTPCPVIAHNAERASLTMG